MEKSIKGTRTEQNLLKSFAGESQARSRYTFFASVAKKEGYEQSQVFSWKQPSKRRNTLNVSLNSWKVEWLRLPLLILQA